MTEGVVIKRSLAPIHEMAAQAAAESSTSTPRFGDARLAAVYAQAKRYVIDNKVLRIYQKLDLRQGYRSIVICNTWRIDRALDSGRVELFEWSFREGQWLASASVENWPQFQMLPIERAKEKADDPSNVLWRSILRKALWRVLDAAGYGDLPSSAEYKGQSRRSKMAEILFDFYTRPRPENAAQKGALVRARRTTLKLKEDRLAAAARALRKNVWAEVIDKSVLSVVAIIKGYRENITFRDYLRYAPYCSELTRLLAENRNCLPLLRRIRAEQWRRTDLFSRKLWVKDGRKTTLLDRSGFAEPLRVPRFRRSASLRLASFETPAAHRWLMRAPVSVVACFATSLNGAALENIAHSNLPKRVPAIVLQALLDSSRRLVDRICPEVQRAFRAWANRCCEIWKAQGFAYLRENMRGLANELRDVLDWIHAEGLARGQPDKNGTWQSMARQSADWHERCAISRGHDCLRWESLVGECEIDGYQVRPLISSQDLAVEGYQLHHCVGTYDAWCDDGVFRIFSLTDAQGARSTLCIERTEGGPWVVQQVRAAHNAAVPIAAEAVARAVAKRYTQATIEHEDDC